MRPSIVNLIVISVFLLFSTDSISADKNTEEASFLGTWQEGLTEIIGKLPSDPPQRLSLAGDILQFQEDHTFRIYLRCGPERESMRHRGIEFLEGKWTLVGNKKLAIQTHGDFPTFQTTTDFVIEDEKLKLKFYPSIEIPQVFGRYDGQLPQTCPERSLAPEMPLPIKPIPKISSTGCNNQKILSYATPVYPIKARRYGQHGWAIVQFIPSPEGVPLNVKIHDSSPEGVFDNAALDAMKSFRYLPDKSNGQYCFQFFRFLLD